MSQLPITSRIKRSPLLKTDPTDPKAKRSGRKEGEDKKEIKLVEKKSSYEGKKMSDEEWKALSPEERRRLNAAVGANKKGEIITEKEEEVITPGEDLDYDTTIMKTKKEGTMLQPWEVRQQLRGQTRADRQVNKTRRKMEKYGAFNDKGEFTPNANLSARDKRKLQQAKSGYGSAKSMSENISTGIEGGRAAGESYFKGQREKVKGEQGAELQLEEARRAAEKKRRDEDAAKNNIVTEKNLQAKNAVEVNNNADGGDDAVEVKADDTTQYGTYETKPAPTNMRSAFKMKAKSPAAKKLQGNQGRLPKHLQDAIKSAPESPAKLGPLAAIAGKALIGAAVNKLASSNKMRSGFKMKGYGKK